MQYQQKGEIIMKIYEQYIGKKVLIRGYECGVYFGTLAELDGGTAMLTNVRTIWRWEGANNLFEVANKGVDLVDSRVSEPVESAVFTGVCEIVPCTKTAIENLEGIKAWEFQK